MTNQKSKSVPYLWPVGKAGFVDPDRILVSARWESAPIKREVYKAKSEGRLIDMTYGRACKWVLFLDSGHIVLAAVPMPVAVLEDQDFEEFLIQKYGEEFL